MRQSALTQTIENKIFRHTPTLQSDEKKNIKKKKKNITSCRASGDGVVVAARGAGVHHGLRRRLRAALEGHLPARRRQPQGHQVADGETQDEHDQNPILVEHHEELFVGGA